MNALLLAATLATVAPIVIDPATNPAGAERSLGVFLTLAGSAQVVTDTETTTTTTGGGTSTGTSSGSSSGTSGGPSTGSSTSTSTSTSGRATSGASGTGTGTGTRTAAGGNGCHAGGSPAGLIPLAAMSGALMTLRRRARRG